MQDIKISLITVVFNAESTIGICLQSVTAQTCKNVEYIIVDGGSTDKTIQIINEFKNHIHHLVSEPDKGIYDAMNKGIRLATGDVIGILNADDAFADDRILAEVAMAFAQQQAGIVYGDLNYVGDAGKVIRKWRSGVYIKGMFNRGWMPPHPTFYCKRAYFDQLGLYSMNYGTAADYELMLRFMHVNQVSAYYLPKVLVKMKIGGASNKRLSSRLKAMWYDLKAMRNNSIALPLLTLALKPLRKISQYFN